MNGGSHLPVNHHQTNGYAGGGGGGGNGLKDAYMSEPNLAHDEHGCKYEKKITTSL